MIIIMMVAAMTFILLLITFFVVVRTFYYFFKFASVEPDSAAFGAVVNFNTVLSAINRLIL